MDMPHIIVDEEQFKYGLIGKLRDFVAKKKMILINLRFLFKKLEKAKQ